jgi:hypothetical protein
MAIISELPDQQQFTDVLNRIIGSEDDGSSLSAAMAILNNLDPNAVAASVGGKLAGHVSASATVDTNAMFGDVQSQIQRVIKGLPSSGDDLLAPILQVIEQLQNLMQGDFESAINRIFAGFNQIQGGVPASSNNLLASGVESIQGLLGEFRGGAFSEIKEWSDMVASLGTEVNAIIAAGPEGLIDRLVKFLAERVAALVADIMPHPGGPAGDLTARFELIMDPSRLTTVASLVTELVARIDSVRVQFEGADFTTKVNVQEAVDTFNHLTLAIASLLDDIEQALTVPVANFAGLTSLLNEKYAELAEVEVIDIGDIRRYVVDAIDHLGDLVNELGLKNVSDSIQEVFTRIDDAIATAQLDQIESFIGDFNEQVQSAIDLLDGQLLVAVASIRNIFNQIRIAVSNLLTALGSFDGEGNFQFFLQKDLNDFLSGINDNLTHRMQPIIDEFESTITNALQSFTGILTDLQGEIASVKADLQALLQGVKDTLESADVPAALEQMAERLQEMLDKLGDLSFDPIVDQVIAEIDKMAEKLRRIDISGMSEISIGALKVSVEVVTQINFSSQISSVLMDGFDELLVVPKQAVDHVQKSVEFISDQFALLKPDHLLQEINKLVGPLQAIFDTLDPQVLLKPLMDWHAALLAELQKLSLNALLKPLIDLHGNMSERVQQVSPAQLIMPLQGAMDELQDNINSLELVAIRGQFNSAVATVNGILLDMAPAKVLQPLLQPFATLESTLTRFRPSTLLQPVNDFFDSISAELDGINQTQVDAVSAAVAPLTQLSRTFDPMLNLQSLSNLFEQILAFIEQLNFAAILSRINSAYGNAKVSFDSDLAGAEVTASFSVLNPLQNSSFTAISTRFHTLRERLKTEFSGVLTPPELIEGYAGVEDKITMLAPAWLGKTLTPAGLRAAVAAANPINVGVELDDLYDGLLRQVMAVSPTHLIQPLQATYNRLVMAVGNLTLDPLLDSLEAAIGNLSSSLDLIDPSVLTTELNDLFGEILTMVEVLDPSAMVADLQELVDTVVALAESMDPQALIAGVDGQLTAAKAIAGEFDVNVFAEPMNEIFDNVSAIIKQIDVGVVLRPVTDRLDTLRDELADGLTRTEKAFVNMLNAIPV